MATRNRRKMLLVLFLSCALSVWCHCCCGRACGVCMGSTLPAGQAQILCSVRWSVCGHAVHLWPCSE